MDASDTLGRDKSSIHSSISSDEYEVPQIEGEEPLHDQGLRATDMDMSLIAVQNMEVGDGFCKKCKSFLDSWGFIVAKARRLRSTERVEIDHYELIYEVITAAKQGCGFCSILLQLLNAYRAKTRESTWYQIHPQRFRLSTSEPGSILVQFDVLTDGINGNKFWYNEGYTYLKFNTLDGHGKIKLCHVEYPLLSLTKDFQNCHVEKDEQRQDSRHQSENGHQEADISLAQKWLTRCNQQHPECNVQESQYLPTRLLQFSKLRIRLILSTDLLAQTKYATLSHSWGPNPQRLLQLTTSNFPAFQNEIKADQLPKTFKDAISVAAELGLEHIWIDSLCIIQDDPLD